MTKPQVAGMCRGMFDSIDGIHLDIADVVESGDKLVSRATLSGTTPASCSESRARDGPSPRG